MCSLETLAKCDTCLEYEVMTDSGMVLRFTLDPRDKDNSIIKTWLFATDFVDYILVRNVGDFVWSTITKEEWLEEHS